MLARALRVVHGEGDKVTRKEVIAQSDFLFARPSFVEGIARVADFHGTLQRYNTSSDSDYADLRAIYADWEAVGKDMRKVVEEHQKDRSNEQG